MGITWNQLLARDRSEIRKLYAERKHGSISEIIERFGVTREVVQRNCDPEYRDRRNRRIRGLMKPGDSDGLHRVHRQGTPTREDVAARLREIPEDTRSITGYVLGDPLPGRSALDRHPRLRTREG